MVAILDYGVGNLSSIKNMFNKIGIESLITNNLNIIENASKLVLPGVGAFDTCSSKLNDSGLVPILNKKVFEDHIPVLGICVGLQLMMESSEEGKLPGLGWIKGKCVKFKTDVENNLKIPHMGWSEVISLKHSKLLAELDKEPRFYFVHSYHVELLNPSNALLFSNYSYPFTAAIEHYNIIGVQFHPEKSHKFGMKLFENFVNNY